MTPNSDLAIALSDGGVILTNFARRLERGYAVANTAEVSRYALSFTSGSLLMREALIAAPIYLGEPDWAKVRQLIEADNRLQARTAATGQRLAREVTQRLAVLTDDEIKLITEATSTERGHLLWVAACRRYRLIGEFADEVVRERLLLLTPTLDHDAFDTFLRSKALWHDELNELKDSTLRKLRATVFRMLTEAGLLDDGRIQPAALSPRIREVIPAHDIRYFPTTGDANELG